MANWYGLSRTNYFTVRDEAAFRSWAATLTEVELINNGQDQVGFYTNGDGNWPSLRDVEEGQDPVEFDFIYELAGHLAEGQVAILITVGHERARYATGFAVAIRSDRKRLDMNLDDIYVLVHSTWGLEPTRAEY